MKNTLLAVLAFMCLSFTVTQAGEINFNAELRPGMKVALVTQVLNNPDANPQGMNILCVPGLVHSAEAFRPLAKKILATSVDVENVLLLDLPGHGESGVPEGLNAIKYGNLKLEDYATSLRVAVEKYRDRGLRIDMIIAHSMGGLITQMAVDQALEACESLHNLGVKKIVLIGSSFPKEIPDPTLESGAILGLLSSYSNSVPSLGKIIAVDSESFRQFFFANLNQVIIPNAPSSTTIDSKGYIAIESYTAAVQVVGTQSMRPSVRAGILNPCIGIKLRMLVGSQDPFSDPTQEKALYRRLTGDSTYSQVQIMPSNNSVHDQIVSNPEEIALFLFNGW